MHSRTAAALQTLRDLPSIRLEAALVLGGDSITPDQQYKKGKKTVFPICIDVYGSEKVIQEVGKRLSKAHTYLQHPINLNRGVPYNNPHYYTVPGVPKENHTCVSQSSGREDQQNTILDIAKVLEEIDHGRKLPSRNADWHIRTPLLEYGAFSKYMMHH